MVNQNTFNWDCTNKDLVIYVPNFGRKNLLVPTLKRFMTTVPDNKWMWLVVNDGKHEDLSDLESEFNLRYFTFEREPANERNGCKLRNFIIRRAKSRLLGTKDPEIIIDGSFIENCININDNQVYRPGSMTEFHECDTQKILDDPNMDLSRLQILRYWDINNIRLEGFHAGCVISTEMLNRFNGYDERYKDSYGFEDHCLLRRFKANGADIIIDKTVQTYHIAHPIIRKFHRTIISNESIYKKQEMKVNMGIEWGTGI